MNISGMSECPGLCTPVAKAAFPGQYKEFMAKRKAKSESKKEVEYVASNLDIQYSIPVGLTSMLASATKSNNKEVWCKLSDIANICAVRLVSRLQNKRSGYNSYADSWTTQTFPGSNIKLRLDMSGSVQTQYYDATTRSYKEHSHPKMSFRCRVKVSGTTTESFTQQQINDYITDKILLGDDEEFCGTPETESATESTEQVE